MSLVRTFQNNARAVAIALTASTVLASPPRAEQALIYAAPTLPAENGLSGPQNRLTDIFVVHADAPPSNLQNYYSQVFQKYKNRRGTIAESIAYAHQHNLGEGRFEALDRFLKVIAPVENKFLITAFVNGWVNTTINYDYKKLKTIYSDSALWLQTPYETLARGSGTCWDTAALKYEILRDTGKFEDDELRMVIADDVAEKFVNGDIAFQNSSVHAFTVATIAGFNVVMDNHNVPPATASTTFEQMRTWFGLGGDLYQDNFFLQSRYGYQLAVDGWKAKGHLIDKSEQILPLLSINDTHQVLPYIPTSHIIRLGVPENLTEEQKNIRRQVHAEAAVEAKQILSLLKAIIIEAFEVNSLNKTGPRASTNPAAIRPGARAAFPSPG